MPGDWKTYKEYKERLENCRKHREEDDDYSTNDDDDVQSLVEMLRDYSE